ncbi:MAG TPA: toxin-antitoxin system YwqK family antitoxin [Kofleriaceae bacterium]|nr:toxin-antitoxin system YwqK family antitoxin [Kofleriaceae bacterium]
MIRTLIAYVSLLLACKGSSEQQERAPTPAPLTAPPAVPGLHVGDEAWVPTEPEKDFWTLDDRACPTGAALRGAAPPRGTAIWCELPDGIRHGAHAAWHERPGTTLASIGAYERGEQNGLWILYHETGKKKAEQTYKAGALHGMQRTYWPNGNRESDGWYRAGVPNGTFTAFDSLGDVAGSTMVENGTGTIALAHPNGTRRLEYRLVDGVRHGLEITFDEAGKKLSETSYEAGVRAGVAMRWDAAGRKREAGRYVGDMKHGVWIEYGEDGSETRRVEYQNGEAVP